MKIDTNNKSYKLASDVAELIKTLRITPHATTKTTPFDAHYWLKPNTPLGYICTLSKISNLSWENTKFSCLDEKILNEVRTQTGNNLESRSKQRGRAEFSI